MESFFVKKSRIIISALIIISILSISIPSFAATKPQIKLRYSTKKMSVGESIVIAIQSKSPSTGRLLYSTTNPKVVRIENQTGKVKAVAEGKAEVIVQISKHLSRTKDDYAYARCTITVLPKVNKVSINTTSKELKPKETVTLKATVSPRNAESGVTWKSSNTAVAKVDKAGKVTAVGKGKATITATSIKDSSKKAKCTINVNEYIYDYKGSRYKITTTGSKLKKVDKKADSICQKNVGALRGECCKVSIYYQRMLNNKVKVNSATASAALKVSPSKKDDKYYSSTYDLFKGIKSNINRRKPVVLYVTSSTGSQHWVTVVGYKGSGNKFSDFLILGSYSGNLCRGGDSSVDVKGGLRKDNGKYKFKI